MTTIPLEQMWQIRAHSSYFQKALALREIVFIEEQGVAREEEIDGLDEAALHLIVLREGAVVATLRILWLQTPAGALEAKIGRFAVRRDLRGQGIGHRLFEYALCVIAQHDVELIQLEAQLDRLGFYENFGFEAHGEAYLDAGILHRFMTNYPLSGPADAGAAPEPE